jgi:hypothetical protein
VAHEALTELVPCESLTVLGQVGLPPVKSGASQLPCCVQNPLPVVALGNNQLALHRTKPVVCLENEASRLPGVGPWRERRSEDDLSGNPHACHGAEAAEEAVTGRESAAEPERCCSGSPSSASGAERTAPGSVVAASAAADQYPGCSAPAGQNRNRCAWYSPSDCNK